MVASDRVEFLTQKGKGAKTQRIYTASASLHLSAFAVKSAQISPDHENQRPSLRPNHHQREYPVQKALITGITGQDGSYLAEFLLSKGYEVHGIMRRASTFNTRRLDHIYRDPHNGDAVRLHLHYGDIGSSGNLSDIIRQVEPDEIYHLAAQSHVRVSFDLPDYTGDVTGLSTVRILEAMRRAGAQARFYQASSSEMFGAAPPPQNECTPFQPQSPYNAEAETKISVHPRPIFSTMSSITCESCVFGGFALNLPA